MDLVSPEPIKISPATSSLIVENSFSVFSTSSIISSARFFKSIPSGVREIL